MISLDMDVRGHCFCRGLSFFAKKNKKMFALLQTSAYFCIIVLRLKNPTMANLKNDNYRFIALCDLQAEFAKAYLPLDLITPEIEKPHVCLLSDGTAEMQFFFRTDDKGTGAMLPVMENAPGFWVEWEATAEEISQCAAFANALDFNRQGKVEAQDDSGAITLLDFTDDHIKEIMKAESRSIVAAWFCLYGAEVLEAAWSSHLEEQNKKPDFKEAMAAFFDFIEPAKAA